MIDTDEIVQFLSRFSTEYYVTFKYSIFQGDLIITAFIPFVIKYSDGGHEKLDIVKRFNMSDYPEYGCYELLKDEMLRLVGPKRKIMTLTQVD